MLRSARRRDAPRLARVRSRHRRLADVGRHARSQHGLEHEGPARPSGTSRRRRTSSGSPTSARRATATRSSPAAWCSSARTTKRCAIRSRRGDRGVLMAFRESNGEFLWQQTHAKLESGRANDWPYQGVASSPLVEGDALYYVSNRGVVFCLDINGFRDNENDGPVTDEKLTGQNDADVIWSFDMMEEVGSYPHNMSNSSPVDLRRPDLRQHVERPGREPRPHPVAEGAGDHRAQQEHRQAGVGRQLGRGPHPARPVVDAVGRHDRRRRSGRLARRATAGCAATRPQTGKKLWEFDTNPKDAVWPQTRNELIATPVIYRGPRLHRQRPGSRARRRRRPLLRHRRHQARRHHADRPRLALRQDPPLDLDRGDRRRPGLHLRLQRLPALPRRQDRPGVLDARHARRRLGLAVRRRRQGLPRRRRRRRRRHGSTARRRRCSAEMNMGSAVYATIVPAHGTLFLNNRNQLFAISAIEVVACGQRQHCSGVLLLSPASGAQRSAARRRAAVGSTAAAAAPADAWRQFRGTPGSPASPPARLPRRSSVLWTYDAGDVIDSSAAIVDGVVYVGAGNGDLLALDLASGKLRWKYTTGNLIGESSPAVGDGAVYIGDLGGLVHAVNIDGRQAAVDVQDRLGDQVVAGRRRRRGAHRLVRHAPLRARREDRQSALEGADQRDGARHAGRPERSRLHRRLRFDPARDPRHRRQGGRTRSRPAPTPARRRSSTALARTSARSTTRCSRSISSASVALALCPDPDRQFPFYSSAALGSGRVILGGRDKFVHALDATTGKPTGRSRRARASIRRRSSPAAASTSGRATASSTCSTRTAGRSSGSSMPAPRITASPAIAAGRLVIGSQDGVIYALG